MDEQANATAEAEASGDVVVRRALVSVSDKRGAAEFARGLAELGIEIVSTGGTARALAEAGVATRSITDLTGSPEMLDGRVKTLHPRLHGGLLARRDNPAHAAALDEHGIEPIDLVCVNLYPFEQTVARPGITEDEAIEQIDIGGPTMVRAAAKNHAFVAVVVSPDRYGAILEELRERDGRLARATRVALAREAFAHTARYDANIARWFAEQAGETLPETLTRAYDKVADLSYGENPHQRAAYYAEAGPASDHLLAGVIQHGGKPLSFNNLLDLDAARRLVEEFSEPACAIVKHNNPCGCAVASTPLEAYKSAFAADPVSAFGGVIALNRPVDGALAEAITGQFLEVLHAPGYDQAALQALASKPNARILEGPAPSDGGDGDARPPALELRPVRGGVLAQDRDTGIDRREAMRVATSREPDEREWNDLLFAWKVCRHVRSNAIVLALGGATAGIGAGQMSRVDSVRLAVEKSTAESLKGAVLASDAFFPFADGPQLAIDAGVTAIIQPGGSKRDDEVIAAAEDAGIAMVLTGRRHFRH